MSIFKKTLILSSAISLILSPSAMASKRLSGAGASFPSKIYTRWFFDLAKSGGPRVNYQAVGSGSGRKAFIDETVNFGASDDPMKEADIKKVTRGLVQIPMVGGTIAFGYNYDCDLKLTGNVSLKNLESEVMSIEETSGDELTIFTDTGIFEFKSQNKNRVKTIIKF